MVWGMALPSDFGEFWPNGEFENGNWYGRLNVDYFHQTPEMQMELGNGRIMLGDYGYYAAGKFTNELGTSKNGDPPFIAIREHEPPQSFETVKGHKTLGSLIQLSGMMLAVDEKLKTIIERLEPGVHQFYPIEIKMPKGKAYSAQYYILVVGQYFDAFSKEDTEFGSVFEYSIGNSFRPEGSKAGMKGLAIRKSVFGKAHLWRDRSFDTELTCFSDELIAEIDKAGLRIPKHYKMKEV